MKLKNYLFLFLSVLTLSVSAQQIPTLPVDASVKTGKLPNGLTYYIRHNDYPAHRADFYIAQRVGSILENDDQRGLAHFLEHMCFNGTKHFPGNALIQYLESVGVQFGTNLNAYTSVDQTVYNICNVPTQRIGVQDSCLLVLHDWANDLTLDSVEIDKERGVIHQEWRMRSTASQRILERSLPELYPGSKYAYRMPIGLMSVVDSFRPAVLRAYYEKWYRPDLQGIIIVGDVDVNRIEQKIKELFSPTKLPVNEAKRIYEKVPDNFKPIVVVEKDKEQTQNVIELMFKQDVFPDSLKNTPFYIATDYIRGIVNSMLGSRFSELMQKPDCPFAYAETEYDNYIFSKTKDNFLVAYLPKEGKSVGSTKAVMEELERARRFGFTATEYARAREEYLSQMDKLYSNREKQKNNYYVQQYVNNFLDKNPLLSISQKYQIMHELVPHIQLDAVNQVVKQMVCPSDTNMVILSLFTEKPGVVYPSKDSLLYAIHAARAEKLTAYVDHVKNVPLLGKLPAEGKIVSEKDNAKFGTEELTLSNGMKVILKKTDFKNDEVLVNGYSWGGSSLLPDSDMPNIIAFNDVISGSGLGEFSNTELTKALAGKQASVNLELDRLTQGISGKSTPKDLKTLFQLMYLNFTDIRKDEDSFKSLMNQYKTFIENAELNPINALKDSLNTTLWTNPLRAQSTIKKAMLPKINYDRIMQIYKQRFANAGQFTVVFTGNFNEDTIKQYVCQYLAPLPRGKKEHYKDVKLDFVKGEVTNKFMHKMQTPQAFALMMVTADADYTVKNAVDIDAIGQVLSMIYLQKIREDAGAAYSASAFGDLRRGESSKLVLQAVCPLKPEMCDTAVTILEKELVASAQKISPSYLQKVKEYMLKKFVEEQRENGYWSSRILGYSKWNSDIDEGYKTTVESLSTDSLAKFMKDIVLKQGNRCEVIMLPEKTKE
ncbi:MAG: insulinase family protein [Bacteroidaceae bacterium]|nr:insulinase family protein [Bacteroidaceae bacterium]